MENHFSNWVGGSTNQTFRWWKIIFQIEWEALLIKHEYFKCLILVFWWRPILVSLSWPKKKSRESWWSNFTRQTVRHGPETSRPKWSASRVVHIENAQFCALHLLAFLLVTYQYFCMERNLKKLASQLYKEYSKWPHLRHSNKYFSQIAPN